MQSDDLHGSTDSGESTDRVVVFRGTRAACAEYGLVLDAKDLPYERVASAGLWELVVDYAAAVTATDELQRYSAERIIRRESAAPFVAYAGSGASAALYALVLIAVAYCTGIELFGVDWLAAGSLDAATGARTEWWRAITALTLHLDQEHLLGNLLFGVGIGLFAGRMFGPGFAWLSILGAGALGNAVDMLVSPSWHRSAGASTAVFAALGLLAGFGWGQRLDRAARRLYRWGPLFGGVCLLALLGAGGEHVDVLGHVAGFVSGTALGWFYASMRVPRGRSPILQATAGVAALALLGAAWFAALRHAAAQGG